MLARRGGSRLNLDELTSQDFSAIAESDPLVILPIGATEEHGSHLPLGTDSFQCEEIVQRLAREFNALVLPPIRYAECRSTRNFPGTISLKSETVQALVTDVLSELARNGISKVIVMSGHAGSGHMAALKLGALRVIEQNADMRVMVLADYDIACDLAGQEFPQDDGHAGQIETSRMLAIRPELVSSERPFGDARPPRHMIVSDPQRYFPSGVMGDSRGASAEKGGRISDYISSRLSDIVAQNFDIPRADGSEERA
ncbi:MAG: creatininase family protein [Methanobacteriota archaeon]|nr:MAG: creatininase family protein [Euryarchaeota archaeon]